ncbi:MAG: TetR/AcrR family transcriptional regulator [Deltaproteobacteria bacterium]|nr:TetR/AcrR family transcriptional regulator [Deltaproteobacteria bacterium]
MKATDKHQKIIQAAVKIFARNGFFNSRISEIAKEANVADGTIYLYFNNKYDILISLFEEEMGKIITNMREELAKEENPLKQLEIFSRVHLKIVEENREMAEVLQVEIRQSSKFMKEYRNKKFAEYVNIISSVIKKGQEQGLIREDVMPGILKRAFFGALDEMSRFWILSPQKKYSTHTAAKQISDFFIRGITVSGHDILS